MPDQLLDGIGLEVHVWSMEGLLVSRVRILYHILYLVPIRQPFLHS
jgi:hypothetical protein